MFYERNVPTSPLVWGVGCRPLEGNGYTHWIVNSANDVGCAIKCAISSLRYQARAGLFIFRIVFLQLLDTSFSKSLLNGILYINDAGVFEPTSLVSWFRSARDEVRVTGVL